MNQEVGAFSNSSPSACSTPDAAFSWRGAAALARTSATFLGESEFIEAV